MTSKENYLEAVRFGSPGWVPLGIEGITKPIILWRNFQPVDWTDAWGIRWEVGLPNTVPFPKSYPLPSLDRLDDYRFPEPGDLFDDARIQEQIAATDRAQKVMVGQLFYLLFERACAVMGMEDFLASFHTHPAEMRAFLHSIAAYSRGVFDRFLELGMEGVHFSEDLGSQRALMTSPAIFREYFLPEYGYIFENVLRAGKLVLFHSCGCVDEIASDLASIGITALNPIQHRANDLAKIKRETYGRLALQGGIDTAVLARGTVAEVRAEVEQVMTIMKPGGGYMCEPDQGIPGIPQENTDALWDAARVLGRYA